MQVRSVQFPRIDLIEIDSSVVEMEEKKARLFLICSCSYVQCHSDATQLVSTARSAHRS